MLPFSTAQAVVRTFRDANLTHPAGLSVYGGNAVSYKCEVSKWRSISPDPFAILTHSRLTDSRTFLTWRSNKSVGALFVNAQNDGAVLKFDVATGAFAGAIVNSVPDALEALALSSC